MLECIETTRHVRHGHQMVATCACASVRRVLLPRDCIIIVTPVTMSMSAASCMFMVVASGHLLVTKLFFPSSSSSSSFLTNVH